MQENNNTIWYILAGVFVLGILFVVFRRKARINPAQTIPDFNADSGEWIQWHKELLAYGYPKTDANRIWLTAFNQLGKDQWQANDYTLRDYAQSQGMNVQDYSILSSTYDFSIETGESVSKGVGTIGTFFAAGVFVAVLLIGGVIYLTIKNS